MEKDNGNHKLKLLSKKSIRTLKKNFYHYWFWKSFLWNLRFRKLSTIKAIFLDQKENVLNPIRLLDICHRIQIERYASKTYQQFSSFFNLQNQLTFHVPKELQAAEEEEQEAIQTIMAAVEAITKMAP